MRNVLLIKTNASGDVVRTTVLLHILKGRVFWITAGYNIPLFPDDYPELVLIPVEDIPGYIFSTNFDLLLNLEEDADLAQKLMPITTRQIVGTFWSEGKLNYTADSAEWFDMSLVSRLPPMEADDLKKRNKFSYQEIIYRMLGANFSGQKYLIYRNNNLLQQQFIGIEAGVGSAWPNKSWHGYERLKEILASQNRRVKVFEKRPKLRQYLDDINECSLIICGDTLAMHVALAYDIACIAIFNCTSSNEIYDYGILKKIESPLLFDAFYKQSFDTAVFHSIPVTEVFNAVELQLERPKVI